jgi:predicted glycogen debranching enzyme
MIRFDRDICRDLSIASKREWLETNGLGGYASSTIVGMNTRRYHGLLVAATKPPLGRLVLLSKLEETAIVDGKRYELSANRYPGVVHPEGHLFLKEFRLDPFPVFLYAAGQVEIEKSIFMAHGQNTTVVQYEFRGLVRDCRLEIRPLIAFRDYHATTHENRALNPHVELEAGNLRVAPYIGLPSLCVAHHGEVAEAGGWYRNFEFEEERSRGLDYYEDLFNPFTIVLDPDRSRIQSLIASTEPNEIDSADALRASEIERRRSAGCAPRSGNRFVDRLVAAADQFIFKRGEGHTVIAGYHWFSDWGRDTMIALPGLTLSAGRPEIARSILLSFARAVDHGMLPNRFPDDGEAPEYNTVDATLWFFEAVRAYLAHTGDLQFVGRELYGVLTEIIRWHECGTRYGIRMDADGLLCAGEPGVQLTWMDAKVGDWVVTPRHGKAVEIQALWYNALRVMEDLCYSLSRGAPGRYGALADRVRTSFETKFWNSDTDCLFDVVDGDFRDPAIRPNQIFAVSLFHKIVEGERAARIVAAVERHLLTPFGLRTLAPSDPQYRGRYEGDPAARDGAYHQGTVWPWLMGPFLRAYFEVHGRTTKAQRQAAQWLSAFARFIEDQGVGQLPEIFDGDAPHRAAGCIAQAWTVAQLLQTCLEGIGGTPAAKPPRKRVQTSGTGGF